MNHPPQAASSSSSAHSAQGRWRAGESGSSVVISRVSVLEGAVLFHKSGGTECRARPSGQPLITPALFSHRTPPNREKRGKSQDLPARSPSPGRREGDG